MATWEILAKGNNHKTLLKTNRTIAGLQAGVLQIE
jgi:hypothetical protein